MANQIQAESDADKAHMYAVNCVLVQDKPGARTRSKPDEIFADYATDLLNDLGADPARLYAAARVAAARSAENVEWPMLWRQAVCAVELCQRAAQLALAPAPAIDVPKILAEGEAEVIAFLEQAGVPGDFAYSYLDLAGGEGCAWPGGKWVNELCGDTTMVTVTQQDDGVYRLESGPADVFWELTNPPDDY
jgi:hypothetical protein